MITNLFKAFAALIISSTVAIAQPTLTAAGINPLSGDSYQGKGSSDYIEPGPAGANQVWDLSLTVPTYSYSNSFIDASSTPYASNFTNSNLSTHTSGIYDFYNTSANAFQYTGQGDSPSSVFAYYDVMDLLRFPFNFNDSYIDTWGESNVTGVSYTMAGTYTVTYDGYGTLIIPQGTSSVTLTNVARIHNHGDYTEYETTGTTNSSFDKYEWFINGIRHAIVSTYTVTGNHPYQTSGYSNDLSTSLNEGSAIISNIITYPNPATHEISFTVTNAVKLKEIQLYNLTGKLQLIQKVDNGGNTIRIGLQNFSPGIYFATCILVDGTTGTKKILIGD